MRAPCSSLFRSIPLLLSCALAPGCSTLDSGTPLSPEEPPPATSGALELTIHEIGARPDPDGYTLTIRLSTLGDPLVRAVGPGGGTLHLPGLPLGVHSLRLDGLAEPCAVNGRHPRAFVISAGATTELDVFISCPGPGAIVVTTVTRGRDPGIAGYGVSVQGDALKDFAIGTSDSLRIEEEELPAGDDWFVQLAGVPDHCQVDLPPAHVRELRGETVRLAYAVACIPPGSRIAVEVGGSVQIVGGPEVVTIAGSFLRDAGPSLSPDRSRVALSRVSELGEVDLYVVGVDGSGGKWLTGGEASSRVGPQAWSPDGSRIVFWKRTGLSSDIYVANADGSGEIRLTHGGRSSNPAWSPDGSSIVFCGYVGDPLEEFPHLYRMSAIDGSGVALVIEYGCDPAWSPDGSRIAFTSFAPSFGLPDLAVIGADGSGYTRLHPVSMTSAETSGLPTWSPDGAWIAYVTGLTGNRIWLVAFDGGGFGEPFPFRFGTAPSWR